MTASAPAAWLDAAALPQLRAELQALYRELDQAIARHRPTCALSGRCCRFREYDHMLFVSAPEALLLVADAPPPVRPLDDGATCPWQDARGHCNAREARPLGCRIFYCDPAFETVMPDLSEEFIARLKALADRHGWPWDYAPLHRHLRATVAEVPGLTDPAPLPGKESA